MAAGDMNVGVTPNMRINMSTVYMYANPINKPSFLYPQKGAEIGV